MGTMPMLEEKPLLVLMDGHALVHRAWHAIQQPLNVSATGEEVRAVYGFLNTFLRTLSDWNPTHIAMTFDLPVPTFRHRRFKDYKAHRPPTPPELRSQFGRIRQLMEAFRIPVYESEGYEADDVLGTLGRQAADSRIEALILTGDTDTLQLVGPWVKVLLSSSVGKRALYDEAAVRERYGGLGPEHLPDLKALQGDTSDNVPGVPGVGSKTALRLVSTYGSIEGVFEHIDEVTPPRVQQALRDNREQTILGKTLVSIVRDVPVTLELDSARFWQYDRSDVVEFVKELEFFSAVSRIPAPMGNDIGQQGQLSMATESEGTQVTVVDSEETLGRLVSEFEVAGSFALSVQATAGDPMTAAVVGLAFATSEGRATYAPVAHEEGQSLPGDLVLERLAPVLESESLSKTMHNANPGMTALARGGLKVRGVDFDTMLAAHVSGRKALTLQALALESHNQELPPITDLLGTGRKRVTMAQAPIERAAAHAGAEADHTLRLKGMLEKELAEKGLVETFADLEMRLVPVLVKMQRDGVSVDSAMLDEMSAELAGRLSEIESGMYGLVGHEFNLNSSQQLGGVLFDELKLPHTKRTKTGYSTDASSLEELRERLDRGEVEGVDPKSYEVLGQILEYRQVSKIKSTYVDALPALVNPHTGRIHTSYNQTGSATGRVSSNDPNVQNIPVRTELGRRVRRAFVARGAPEWALLGADYSQIELRILAHMSQDPGLVESFRRREDIHSATASSVYDVPIGDVTPEMRRIAKIMNFGVLYGLSAFGISRQTDLSADEGAFFIEAYFGKYPGIHDYIESTKEKVRKQGYVETLKGRRRYIYEVQSRSYPTRAAGERMAVNMPIQGTAADILKIAMVRIQERIDAEGLRSLMILQVHDELIFEVPEDELALMRSLVLDLMPSAMDLTVPLEVELKTGYNWDQME